MEELKKVVAYYNDGEFAQALRLCDLLLKKEKSAALYYWRATNLLRLDRLNEALESNQTALERFPGHPDLLGLDGVVLFHLKKNNAALERMNLAVSLEPKNPYRYSSRAFIRDAMGDTQGAIEDYEVTIDLDPEDAIAHNNIGLLKEKLGYKKRAQGHYKKADRLAVDKNGALVDYDTNVVEERYDQETSSVVANDSEAKVISSINWKHFFKTLKSVFTSSEERKAFWKFLTKRSS